MKPLAIALLILFAASMVHAQPPPPWPPDITAIFAPGVEVVNVEQTTLPPDLMTPTATPPPPNHCGGGVQQPWLAWVFDSPPDATHLCNTKTGELSLPLPDGYTWDLFSEGGWKRLQPTTSPDGKWVIFAGLKAETNGQPMVLNYDPAAQTYQVIGEFAYADSLKFDNWITNQILLIDTYNMGNRYAYDHFMYVVDLRYPTLSKFGKISEDIVQYNPYDSPHIIIKTGLDDYLHCATRVYYIETQQLVDYDPSPFCDLEYYDEKTDAAYYRRLTADGKADVVRYDHESGEQAIIYHGAVENVAWVSPDEHMAALMLDDEPRDSIAVLPKLGYYGGVDVIGNYEGSHLVLLDLMTGRVFYRTPAVWFEWQGWWPRFMPYPYIENCYFLPSEYVTGSNILIQLYEDGHVGETLLEGYPSPLLGGNWALLTASFYSGIETYKFDLFNIETGQKVGLIDTDNQYIVQAEHFHNNLFRVTVAPSDKTDLRRMIYEVRVPGVDIPEST